MPLFRPINIGFSANKNSVTQTGIASVTNTKLTFTTEDYDQGGYYDAANSRWYPPAGRPVLISAYCALQPNSGNFVANISQALQLWKNGAQYILEPLNLVTTARVAGILVYQEIPAAGDYYEIYVQAEVSVGTIDCNGAPGRTRFQGVIL